MGVLLKAGVVNPVQAGSMIFSENEPVSYVCAIVKGKVSFRTDKVQMLLGPGSFFGIGDLFVGHYLADYVAEEDAAVYAFPATTEKELRTQLETNNKDYRGLMVSSLTRQLFALIGISRNYHTMSDSLYQLLSENYVKYKEAAKAGGAAAPPIAALERIQPYSTDLSVEDRKLVYYEELAKVPTDVQKLFFGCSEELTMFHVRELSACLLQFLLSTAEEGAYLLEQLPCLYNDGEQSLLYAVIRLAYALQRNGRASKDLQTMVDALLEAFDQMEGALHGTMGAPFSVNRERLEKMYHALLSNGEIEEHSAGGASEEDLYRELKNSMKQILDYSRLEASEYKEFAEQVELFAAQKERMATDDSLRLLRRKISEGFYKVYRAVFLVSLSGKETMPLPVRLFLDFGYIDERLLTREQAVELCRLDISTKQSYHCTLFTIPEWLKAVYTGERQPSKNEFDLEYNEMLRDLKKTGEITEEEEKKRLVDPMQKLDYEIQNMFRYNHRIVNGQPSVFVPILCSEQMMSSPAYAAVTKDRMGQTIEKYREVDFSVFYRELTYASAEAGIEKEFEMKEIVPDVILFPAYGQGAAMWQELSCKRRDSAGRFLFPIMVEGSLDDLIVRIFGRYRWELCRTMQGTSWNNIQYKSLTSEYTDYIQFYRKNKDLSEDRKEKVKAQIAKGKNSTREVFVLDYELWIKSEAMGGIRLNRVAREILAMYCPFNRSTRKALESQPAFADALTRYNRETQKKVREIELRYHALMKQGITLPKALTDTLSFYKDM